MSRQKNIKRVVWQRDQWKCRYCGLDMKGDMITVKLRKPQSRITVDHVIPTSKGGSNELENLVTCCQLCNTKKKDDLLTKK
jgi:5-methylcytosine-specific restriction endonuclease McrA